MALLGTIALVVLVVALRLLLPPAPGLAGLARTFGKRTAIVLSSAAITLAVLLIVLTRH